MACHRKYHAAYCLLATVALSCLPLPAIADPVLDWNAAMLNAARKNNTPSAHLARNFALLHLATAGALLGPGTGESDDAAALTAAWAACDVVAVLYPSHRVEFERLRDGQCKEFSASKADPAACREHGLAISHRVLEERCNDGIATSISYIPKTAAGQWRRAPPFFRLPELPQWGVTVKPLVLERPDQFRPPGPPAMDSAEYAAAVQKTESLGRKESTVRTSEQTMIAKFWSDFSYTEMPVGHWNSIARSMAESRHLTSRQSARMLVLLNLALADTGIATWEAKYHYNAWRPVTMIRRADETKNSALEPDKSWMPLLNTPPHPEYPSGHSAFSGAATTILAHFFGADALSFDAQSDTLPDQHRHFESLKACAEECGNSRVYGGIHFPFSCVDGLKLGGAIGDYVSTQMEKAPLWQPREAKIVSQP